MPCNCTFAILRLGSLHYLQASLYREMREPAERIESLFLSKA